jgi:large subunit ribosomal protein L30
MAAQSPQKTNEKEKPKAAAKPASTASGNGERIAAVLIRTTIDKKTEVCDTLTMLRLRQKNSCVVLQKTPSMLGMLRKIKDVATFGEITEETYKLLCEKRGEKDPAHPGQIKPYFRLSPPRKGFERKGTKKAYTVGGALGYRGPNMDALLRRMI